MDFGLFVPNSRTEAFENPAVQKAVHVLPTQTYYTFACGPVEPDLVFTAPLMLDDLDLISTPVNYISYQVRSTDKKQHDVQVYIETTPQLAVNKPTQPTVAKVIRRNGLNYVQAGTIDHAPSPHTGATSSASTGDMPTWQAASTPHPVSAWATTTR